MIDVQGTLIDDKEKKPIAGAIEAVRFLRENRFPYVLVTNNTKQESETFKRYLREQGFVFDDEQYLDPLMVLDRLLPPSSVAAYGSPQFLDVLRKRGYRLDFEHPAAVLVAIREDFTNDDYAHMIELVLNGAKLIGMHETSIYAKHGRRYPGVGAILKMIAFATGKTYDVVGKPSRPFYSEALEKLRKQDSSVIYEEVTMISDDPVGDLMGARAMGMQTVLVLSGKIASLKEVKGIAQESANAVVRDISEWFETIRKGAA